MNKRIFYVLGIIIMMTASCSKNDSSKKVTTVINDDNRCISRLWTVDLPDTLSATEHTITDSLMLKNGLVKGTVRYTHFQYSTLGSDGYVHINADQYVNGLPLFNQSVVYNFENGTYINNGGANLATSTLDTIPTLRLTQVRTLFAAKVQTSGISASSGVTTDSCMIAEFGYYNADATTNATSGALTGLVKAWKVYFAANPFVVGYFKDDGTLLLFSSGIVI